MRDVERTGVRVRVVSARVAVGRSWHGAVGTVWGLFRRGEVDDYVLVAIEGNGVVIIGFAPDELAVEA